MGKKNEMLFVQLLACTSLSSSSILAVLSSILDNSWAILPFSFSISVFWSLAFCRSPRSSRQIGGVIFARTTSSRVGNLYRETFYADSPINQYMGNAGSDSVGCYHGDNHSDSMSPPPPPSSPPILPGTPA